MWFLLAAPALLLAAAAAANAQQKRSIRKGALYRFVYSVKAKPQLTDAQWKNLVDSLQALGGRDILATKGDPSIVIVTQQARADQMITMGVATHFDLPGGAAIDLTIDQLDEVAPPPVSIKLDKDDSELLSVPDSPSTADLLWRRYAQDPRRQGPSLEAEEMTEYQGKPKTRPLTDYERWALEPYFPVASDLTERVLHLGQWPPWLAKSAALPQGVTLFGITDPETGDIWFPHMVRLWERFWLAVLAHEVVHAAQLRMGATRAQAEQSIREHGYVLSPLEVQARWMQRKVLDDLEARARAFYDKQPEKV